jgi:hypothetical protein
MRLKKAVESAQNVATNEAKRMEKGVGYNDTNA